MKTENLNPPDEPRIRTCPDCDGAGVTTFELGGDYHPCITCNATGQIIDDENPMEEILEDDLRLEDLTEKEK